MATIKIALAGNPNCGKTTLFNALTGSNQFVGNWPGVTVEKKEGRLKKHDGVVIMDLPGIYSLSPYTLEEVVSRNYLIGERPDAILNIIDGTNLERNLYLTTQLTELGIPVVVAVNMMDVVRKNGDKINCAELSRQLGCRVVEISALKGDGIMQAAEAAIDAAKSTKTVPMHTFSGPVEHAIAHIEEAVVHNMPEEQQRWYAIKVFERDSKVLEQLNVPAETMKHVEADIQAAEKELDDDSESIITNERYIYIAEVIKSCYKKKSVGKLSASDKIDRVVTNRWLGLPIFVVVMFLVYYISMVGVGSMATDWANDGVFGDGWHLFGIGSSQYEEAAKTYGDSDQIIDAFVGEYGSDEIAAALDAESEDYTEEGAKAALEELVALTPDDANVTYELEDEETLKVTEVPDTTKAQLEDAVAQYLNTEYKEAYGAPDTSTYGVWVPGIPVLIGDGLEKIGCADWLNGLILDGIVAGVGAVLGFVPQMLVLFLLLAFLEACGYMARIAFVLDRVFRKFGLSGKSFIPILIGTGCGVPGIMASRTIENQRDRRMTIMTTTFIPCGAKMPVLRSMWERGWSFIKKAGTIILLSTILVWFTTYFGVVDGSLRMLAEDEIDHSLLAAVGNAIAWIFKPLGWGNWQATVASITGLVAKENIVGTMGILYGGTGTVYANLAAAFTGISGYSFLAFNLLCAPCFAAMGAIKREMNNAKWTWFAIGYQCVFAYIVALIIYQLGLLFTGAGFTVATVAALALLAAMIYLLVRRNPYDEEHLNQKVRV